MKPNSHPESHDHHEHHKRHRTLFERLRTLFFAGILVIVPAVIAVYAVIFLMQLTDGIFGNFIERSILFVLDPGSDEPEPQWVPLVSLLASFLMALSVILLIGWASTFLLVRRLIVLGESLISRVPLVKFFYNVPKEVLNTFALQQKSSFKRVVLIEYPRKGIWAVGFATGELSLAPVGITLVAVFAPTTPNPTSGFLLYLQPDEVFDTNLSIEEGARLIISGGILSPESLYMQTFCGLEVEPKFPSHVTMVTPQTEDLRPH